MEKRPEDRSPRDVFAWRVWELVFKRDMKLTELAEKAGVPYKRLHACVRMGQEPPLEVVVKVADALGVSVDYLLGRVDQTNQLLREKRSSPRTSSSSGGLTRRCRKKKEGRCTGWRRRSGKKPAGKKRTVRSVKTNRLVFRERSGASCSQTSCQNTRAASQRA